MIKHILTDDHKEHFKQAGIPVSEHVEVDPAKYKEHYANWKRTLPDATHDELHKRALAHASWLDHAGQEKLAVPAPDVVSEIKSSRAQGRHCRLPNSLAEVG